MPISVAELPDEDSENDDDYDFAKDIGDISDEESAASDTTGTPMSSSMISPALKSKTSTPVQAEFNQEFKKPPDVVRALNFEAENSKMLRSKVDLKEVPIEELETQFQPPDITDDMYDVDNNLDENFGQFLSEIW